MDQYTNCDLGSYTAQRLGSHYVVPDSSVLVQRPKFYCIADAKSDMT